MRNAIPAQPQLLQNTNARRRLPFGLQILLLTVLTTGTLFAAAQQPAPQSPAPHKTSTAAHKAGHAHSRPSAAPVPQAAPAPTTPVSPKPPDWPANDHPSEASVVWNSQGLHIEASNSSLSQILKDVAQATGTKVVGLGSDDRIFGSYGPGPARDVLNQLLDGSGYNILMIGDQGQGTPREIVLSAQPKGDAPPTVINQAASTDENADADEQTQQPQPPPAIRNGFTPGAPPRTPQQIMQEMQQRQQVQQGNNPQ